MIKSINSLRGHALAAIDGEIGQLKDVLFDDQEWKVRYLVVRTGDWLAGRDVLISPRSISGSSPDQVHLHAALTREQIENSPDVNFERPIPRHFEEDFYQYYGWSPYWVGFPLELFPAAILSPDASLGNSPRPLPEVPPAEAMLTSREMSHLRSAREIEGYHLHATDGDIGHVADFLINSESWQVESVIADTRNWWPGKRVVLSINSFDRIDWDNRLGRVRMTRSEIKSAPEYSPNEVSMKV